MNNLDPIRGHKFKLFLVLLPVLLAILSASCSMEPGVNNANGVKPPTPTPSPIAEATPAPGPPNCRTITPARTFECPKDETVTFVFKDLAENTAHNYQIRLEDNTTIEKRDVVSGNGSFPVKLDKIKNVHLLHNLIMEGDTTAVEIFDSQHRVFFTCLDPGIDFPRGCFFKKGLSDIPASTTYTFKIKP